MKIDLICKCRLQRLDILLFCANVSVNNTTLKKTLGICCSLKMHFNTVTVQINEMPVGLYVVYKLTH
jgi:hypothetical protein